MSQWSFCSVVGNNLDQTIPKPVTCYERLVATAGNQTLNVKQDIDILKQLRYFIGWSTQQLDKWFKHQPQPKEEL